MKKHPRRNKLIRPGFQLKLIGSFVGLAGLALLLQFLFLGQRLTDAASKIEGGGGEIAEAIPGMLLSVLVISIGILLPIIFAFGILLTFRIAGPLYRFEQHLGAIARGEDIGLCKIRKGDQLQSLCDKINAATETLRKGQAANQAPAEQEPEPEPEPLRSAG